MEKHKTVEEYISSHDYWQNALILLRDTIRSTQLTETVKWGAPVYTFEGKNIVGLGAFKSYVGIWFFQGALLKDKKKKLMNAQEGKTKALRQWRFNSAEEITLELETIRAYLEEAILNQKQGKIIKPTINKKPLLIPKELATIFSTNQAVKAHFNSLSSSKRREYAEYIDEAKRAETKQKRLEKMIPFIMEGKGLHDKYRR